MAGSFSIGRLYHLKHGVDQCIGDTLGPGGVFRALRSIPVMLDLAKDMGELCPDAYVLQCVNPMLKHNGQDLYPLVYACALDPLTGAALTLKEIRDMASDVLEAQRARLPQFEG